MVKDKYFISLDAYSKDYQIPENFRLQSNPEPLAVRAAEDLQYYLATQSEWNHNFGLTSRQEGAVIGKMFGVLVVKNQNDDLGYLAAFSGKLARGNHHTKFVPPVFDGLIENGFVTLGMRKLSDLSREISELERNALPHSEQIKLLKLARSNHSNCLQKKIFNQYYFLNQAGEKKSLHEIFKDALYKNPPSGAGECAGPKLLQYAFLHKMKPLALTEFWWGLSPKSAQWKHGSFYSCCKEKCEPILNHMLNGLTDK